MTFFFASRVKFPFFIKKAFATEIDSIIVINRKVFSVSHSYYIHIFSCGIWITDDHISLIENLPGNGG